MFRPRHLNAPCPIILRTRGDGTLAAACAVADTPLNPVDAPANAGLRQRRLARRGIFRLYRPV